MARSVTRRALLRRSLMASAGAFLAACTPVAEKEVVKETVVVPGTPEVVEKVVTATPSAHKVSPPGSLPIVTEKTTLNIMAAGDKDYNINAYTKWLREQTKVDVQYIMVSWEENEQKLNLAVASGNLPDVIAFFDMKLADQEVLAQQGIVIPLDDLIEEYGFETKRMFKEQPKLRDQILLSDGKIYALPTYSEVLHSSLQQKMWIYQPWLDKLGLEMPTTTDEFYQVLKAFKTKDPNGNGKADEIPVSGCLGGWSQSLDRFLMQPFVFNDRMASKSLMVDGGVIKASYVDPGWQEGLKYLNKLFAEGLIDPQVFTQDQAQLTALVENADAPLVGATTAGWFGGFTVPGGPSGRSAQYVVVPPLKGPTGLRQTPWNPYNHISQGEWLITKACKDPEVAFRLADFFYSWDATMRNVWGEYGVDWRLAKPGEVGISGGPATHAALRPFGSDPNTYMNVLNYQSLATRTGMVADPNDVETRLTRASQEFYVPYGVQDKCLPYLVFSPDQSRQLSELEVAINGYVDQSFAEFVIGKLNPESDWSTYLKQLNDLGLDQFLQIYQDAYDAKLKG